MNKDDEIIQGHNKGLVPGLLILLISLFLSVLIPVAPVIGVALLAIGIYAYRHNADVYMRTIAIFTIAAGIMMILIVMVVVLFSHAPIQTGTISLNLAEQKESGVNIGYDIVCLQGLEEMENISGIEHVKVNGTIWNTGRKNANNVSVTVIYTDIAHNKVVRNTTIERVELLSEGMHSMNFESKYLRESTIPKTAVDPSILIEWEEDRELKTLTVNEIVGLTEE